MCIYIDAGVCLCVSLCYWQEGKEVEQELNLKFPGGINTPKKQNMTTAVSILAQYTSNGLM